MADRIQASVTGHVASPGLRGDKGRKGVLPVELLDAKVGLPNESPAGGRRSMERTLRLQTG